MSSRSSRLAVAAVMTMLAPFAGAAEPPPAPVTPPATGTTPPPLPEVTIKGRLTLQRRLSSFVYGITEMENAEGVARWSEPVCPLVAGLPGPEGEFVLERVSEIARAAQVPLAGEHCRPNFNVLVSADPQRDLQDLHSHARSVLFGNAPPALIREFMARPGPVRVWYKTAAAADGIPVGGRVLDAPIPQLEAPMVRAPPGGSHLQTTVTYGLEQVIMIVDQRRLRGLSRAQLADYVALVGLAQIKPEAHLGDADTILRLFDSAPDAAPTGLSSWDQAFLKALYTSNQENKLQRNEMARLMVEDVLGGSDAPQAGNSGTEKP